VQRGVEDKHVLQVTVTGKRVVEGLLVSPELEELAPEDPSVGRRRRARLAELYACKSGATAHGRCSIWTLLTGRI
jgi:hypothetical protein